jgi:hypothetical protein
MVALASAFCAARVAIPNGKKGDTRLRPVPSIRTV